MEKKSKIYVAGHNGMLGSAILGKLYSEGYRNILVRTHSQLDLSDQSQVKLFFEKEKPEYVFFAAAKVGGIFANNTYRADFIYENTMMQCNVLHQAFLNEVKKLIFYSCADIYPKNCPQPAKEEYLLTGPVESTCEPFAVSKISGVKICESYNRQYGTQFLVVVPPNIYGPNENYDIMNSQVLPSLLRNFHEAKVSNQDKVIIWGTGRPVRDFIFVNDVVDASLYLMNNKTGDFLYNVGTGKGSSIKELAKVIKKAVGFTGDIVYDTAKPDGVAKKLLDSSRINKLGWECRTELSRGVELTYGSFLEQVKKKEIRTTGVSRVKSCQKDKKVINARSKKSTASLTQPDSYSNKVVLKPWGYEFLVFENESIAVWFLHLGQDHSTSMHCHRNKKTSLVLLSGKAMNNTLDHRRYLKGGDAVILEKGVFHSTKALSKEGIDLLEIESPPIKTDLLRLQDKYGREYYGYEGIGEMETININGYNYFNFTELEKHVSCPVETDSYTIIFEVFTNNREFKKGFKTKSGEICVSLRGSIYDGKGNVVLSLGDAQKSETFINDVLSIKEKLVLLRIKSQV